MLSGETRTNSVTYDVGGNVLASVDPLGRTTESQYDSLGRQVAVVDALGNTNRLAFDLQGSVTNLIDANGNLTRFEYDLAGRLTKKIYADDNDQTYEYNDLGRLVQSVDCKGQKATFDHDTLGRLTSNEYYETTEAPTPEKTVVFTYDTYGRMLTYDDGATAGTYTVTYESDEALNDAPVLAAIGNKSGATNAYIGFAVSATDPDNTTPALTTGTLPSGAAFTDNGDGTGSFGWTPTSYQTGDYCIKFTASDDSLSDSETITVTVTGDPPNPWPSWWDVRGVLASVSVTNDYSAVNQDQV